MQGVLATPVDGRPPYPGAVVCHAHPLFGGQMDSPVTSAICQALTEQGVATLRFNFRAFGEGATEAGGSACVDAESALATLRAWREVRPKQCGVVGYSAGAAAIARGLHGLKDAKAFVLIAPPLSSVRSSQLATDKRPKLFLAGSKDKIVEPEQLEALVAMMRQPTRLLKIEGADHTLRGHEQEVAEAAALFLGELLRK